MARRNSENVAIVIAHAARTATLVLGNHQHESYSAEN